MNVNSGSDTIKVRDLLSDSADQTSAYSGLPLSCMMFSPTSSDYTSSFPPLETHTDSQRNIVSKPFIPSPITSTGHLEPPKPFE